MRFIKKTPNTEENYAIIYAIACSKFYYLNPCKYTIQLLINVESEKCCNAFTSIDITLKKTTLFLDHPLLLRCDNMSAIILTKNLKHSELTSHIAMKLQFTKQLPFRSQRLYRQDHPLNSFMNLVLSTSNSLMKSLRL